MRDIQKSPDESHVNNILYLIKIEILKKFYGTRNNLDNLYNAIDTGREVLDRLYAEGRTSLNSRDYIIDANHTLKIYFIKNKISKLEEEDILNNNNNNHNKIAILEMVIQDCLDWKRNYPNEIRIDISELDFGL